MIEEYVMQLLTDDKGENPEVKASMDYSSKAFEIYLGKIRDKLFNKFAARQQMVYMITGLINLIILGLE